MARPKTDNPATTPFQIRWRQNDLDMIERTAKMLDCTISEFIRGAAVKEAIDIGGHFVPIRKETYACFRLILMKGHFNNKYCLIRSLKEEGYEECRIAVKIPKNLGERMAAASIMDFQQLYVSEGLAYETEI